MVSPLRRVQFSNLVMVSTFILTDPLSSRTLPFSVCIFWKAKLYRACAMTFQSRIPTLHLLRLKDTQPKVGQTWQSCYASHRKSDQTSFLLSIANIISFMVILEEEFVSCKKPWHDMVTFLYYQGRHGSGMQIRASSNRQQHNISTFACLFYYISICYEIQSCRVSSDFACPLPKKWKVQKKKVERKWISERTLDFDIWQVRASMLTVFVGPNVTPTLCSKRWLTHMSCIVPANLIIGEMSNCMTVCTWQISISQCELWSYVLELLCDWVGSYSEKCNPYTRSNIMYALVKGR